MLKGENYFKKEISMLKLFGVSLYGNEGLAYKIYSFIAIFLTLSYPVVTLNEVFKHDRSTASYLFAFVCSTFIAGVGIIVVLLNSEKLLKLFNGLSMEPYLPNSERGGNVEAKLTNRCISITNTQSIICWVCVFGTVSMATMITLVKRINSKDSSEWEFLYGPITLLNVTYSPNYEITWLYQVFCCFSSGCCYCTVTLIMVGILAHVSVQFKILQNNLKRFGKNAYELMKKDQLVRTSSSLQDDNNPSLIPWKYLKQSLHSILDYHFKIFELIFAAEEIFSTFLLITFLVLLAMVGLLVYNQSIVPFMDIRFLKSSTDIVSALFPILLLSYWSQEVQFESEEVGKAVFQVNFTGTDIRVQRELSMLILRSQKSAKFRAGNFIEMSLSTFLWIVRTSYSAFMFLKHVNSKQI